ncbi:MAG: VOC family protein [Clostridia bacterium]
MIRGSDFVVYYVTDLDRAVAFYRDVLRLPLSIFKPEWNWAEFDASPTTLVLFGEYPGAPVKAGERGAVGIALAVENMADAVWELQQQGVAVEYGPVELTTCYYAMIRDPAGNPVFLHQRKDGTYG